MVIIKIVLVLVASIKGRAAYASIAGREHPESAADPDKTQYHQTNKAKKDQDLVTSADGSCRYNKLSHQQINEGLVNLP